MKKILVVIFAVTMIFGMAQAQKPGLNSVRPMVGVTFPESPWNTGFVVGADVDMGELMDNVHLVPGFAYWSSSYSVDFGASFGGTFDVSLSDFRVGADAFYYVPSVKGLYAGGGLNLNFFGSDAEGTKIGIDFVAGYELPMKSFTLFAQGKYNIVSDFSSLDLVVGAQFPLK